MIQKEKLMQNDMNTVNLKNKLCQLKLQIIISE